MKYSQRIQELPPNERPYEKCLHSGPEKLTDSELLAVVLRSGTRGSSNVLENYPSGLQPEKPENFWIFTVRTQLQRIIWNGCGTKSRSR